LLTGLVTTLVLVLAVTSGGVGTGATFTVRIAALR
jgi:hypothetical protein